MIALLLASLVFQTVDPPIEEVVIHPIVAADYMCSEHWEGQLAYPGDSLGADCVVMGGLIDESAGYLAPFRTDGTTNEDWYGWNQPLLAPFDGEVVRVMENPVVNVPGQLGSPPASFLVFARSDGTHVLFAHVQAITVKVGDRVVAGQPVAYIGNNGFGRSPHTHIGAWRGETPLQIRFDLRAMARLRQP
jgi:hypothetical protein